MRHVFFQDGRLSCSSCSSSSALCCCEGRFGLFVLCRSGRGGCGQRETLVRAKQRLPEGHVPVLTVELEDRDKPP